MRISEKNVNCRRTESDQSPPSQGSQTAIRVRFYFSKSARILRRTDFKQIAQLRQRYYGQLLTIDYRTSDQSKLGITVSRKFGNAVVRNRFKRLVREAFRLTRDELAFVEMVVMPQREVSTIFLNQVIEELLQFSHAQSTAAKSC